MFNNNTSKTEKEPGEELKYLKLNISPIFCTFSRIAKGKNTKRKESTKFITDWFVDNPGQNRGTPATDSRFDPRSEISIHEKLGRTNRESETGTQFHPNIHEIQRKRTNNAKE